MHINFQSNQSSCSSFIYKLQIIYQWSNEKWSRICIFQYHYFAKIFEKTRKSNDDELTLETFNNSVIIPPLQISKTNIIRLATNSRNRISSLFEAFLDSRGKDKFPRGIKRHEHSESIYIGDSRGEEKRGRPFNTFRAFGRSISRRATASNRIDFAAVLRETNGSVLPSFRLLAAIDTAVRARPQNRSVCIR